MVGVLFDSNILIDFLNGVVAAKCELDLHPDKAISLITWMEVMNGAPADAEATLSMASFFQQFQILSVDPQIARETVQVYRTRKMKLPDAIIKATANVSGRTLVTRNSKDFPPGTGVRIPYLLPAITT